MASLASLACWLENVVALLPFLRFVRVTGSSAVSQHLPHSLANKPPTGIVLHNTARGERRGVEAPDRTHDVQHRRAGKMCVAGVKVERREERRRVEKPRGMHAVREERLDASRSRQRDRAREKRATLTDAWWSSGPGGSRATRGTGGPGRRHRATSARCSRRRWRAGTWTRSRGCRRTRGSTHWTSFVPARGCCSRPSWRQALRGSRVRSRSSAAHIPGRAAKCSVAAVAGRSRLLTSPKTAAH